jgi:hypothetical protein
LYFDSTNNFGGEEMNLKLFMDTDYRNNLLMQTRQGNDICHADSYSAEEVKRNSSELSLTPLFHTSPPQINYSKLTMEVNKNGRS